LGFSRWQIQGCADVISAARSFERYSRRMIWVKLECHDVLDRDVSRSLKTRSTLVEESHQEDLSHIGEFGFHFAPF
jgi:hypothetical protein